MTEKKQNIKPRSKPQKNSVKTSVRDAIHQLVYEQALKDFPYPNLQATGGYTEPGRKLKHFIWSKEFVFSPQEMLNDVLGPRKRSSKRKFEGWALIDLWDDNGDITVEAACDVAKNGDWQKGRIMPPWKMIWGYYDLDTRQWSFWLSR